MAPESALIRRNSTGDFIQIKEAENVLPRYLRASVDSCHDLCKYGKKIDVERKAKTPFPKRYRATPDKSQDTVKGVNSEHRRKNSEIATKPSLHFNSQTPTMCAIIKKEVPAPQKIAATLKQDLSAGKGLCGFSKFASGLNQNPRQIKEPLLSAPRLSRRHSEIIITKDLKALQITRCEVIKKEVPASARRISASSKPVSSTGEGQCGLAKYPSSLNQNPWKTKASVLSAPRRLSRRLSEIIIPKDLQALQMTSMGVSSSRRNNETKISKDVDTSKLNKRKSLISATVSTSPKPSTKSFLNINSRKNKHPKKVSNLKNRKSVKKLETETPSTDILTEKTLYVIEPEADHQTVGLAENCSLHITPSLKAKAMDTKSVKKLVTETPSTDILPERTLYVIEPEADNQTVGLAENGSLHTTPSFKAEAMDIENGRYSTRGMKSTKISSLSLNKGKTHSGNRKHYTQSSSSSFLISSPSTLLSSESMHTKGSGSTSKQVGTKTENQLVDSKVRHRSRPRRIGRVVTEDEDSSPRKLKFRRGKVVDIRPENSSVRRLKFKRQKIVGENQSGNAENTRERSLRKLLDVDVELDGTKTEPVTVVLRHQDVEGKKETQSLFNHVIEETASKLVESRKSKVKALVDAFETVFSLQETKSSEVTSEC